MILERQGIMMAEKDHYSCKHFQAFFDGVTTDEYCNRKKEWFWVASETPLCEFFEENDGDME